MDAHHIPLVPAATLLLLDRDEPALNPVTGEQRLAERQRGQALHRDPGPPLPAMRQTQGSLGFRPGQGLDLRTLLLRPIGSEFTATKGCR